MNALQLLSLTIFLFILLLIVSESIHRTYASLIGAGIFLLIGVVSPERLLEYISLLYQRVHMVHGDMSEYNVLLDPDTFEPVVIDMGQSVLLDHPLAEEMLVRDIANIVRLAREHGLFYDVDTCIQNVKEVGV